VKRMRILAGAGSLAAVAALAVPRLWRGMLDWGATAEEVRRALPGDELLPDADLVATRAISIAASPVEVWPWLVQIGVGRAGAYAYDWLDRLFGLDVRSSRRIVPEFQGLAVGDMIPVANDGTGLRVRAIERERALATSTDDGTWAWTWTLEPAGDFTRLISRTRMATSHQSLPGRVATRLLLVPASWVMERRMLLGLRDRAEGRLGAATHVATTRESPGASSVAATSDGVAHSDGVANIGAPGAAATTTGTAVTDGPAAAEIAPEVHLLGPWGRAQTNAYLVRDGSSWLLIDAGWENDGPRIQAAARSLLGPGQVPAAIFLTHAHPDHDGSARDLAQAWGCPIYAHPAEIPLATGDFRAMQMYAGPLDRRLVLPLMRAVGRGRREAILAGSSLAGIVQPLPPGGAIPGMEGWQWIHTPGHTPGHVAFFRARDRVVISGDAVLTLAVNSWSGLLRQAQGLSGPPWYTTWDREAATASIVAIADLEPAVLAAGHGLPLAGPGTAAAVHAFAARTIRKP
jgi:glyoxylase-like metal-dependent hydrolase (beta-lactamase superfamily II)